MSQMNEGPVRAYPNTTALLAHRRVKSTTGVLAYASSTDVELGTLEQDQFTTTLAVNAPVRLRTAQGTVKMVAADAITAFDPVYAAANGKVSASGTVLIGIAQHATTADLDAVEVLRRGETSDSAASGGTTAAAFEVDSDSATPKLAIAGQSGGTGDFTTTLKPETTLSADNTVIVPEANGDTLVAVALAQTLTSKTLTSPIVNLPTGTRLVTTDADNRTVTAAESGSTFASTGSGGAGTFALPAATKGLNYTFHVDAAQELRIDPDGTETIGLPSTGVQGAAGKYLTANAVGEWVKLICVVAGVWTVEGYAGTWTAES